jgi:ABC-2 type transport system ATP-binding protein
VNSTDFVIQANQLTKHFGSEIAVENVTFKIPRGKIFGFIGPSGGGKTTTTRLLLGLYQPTMGQAQVLGQSPTNFSRQTREQIGYMPQLFVLYPELTVIENLSFVASIYGLKLDRHGRMAQLLDFVELGPHQRKLARNISGGMQRRLSLAATLIHNPQVIFLDEPTAGIDPVLRRKFWDYFKEQRSQGHTYFITTQYVGEARYCDYVGVLSKGRLLAVDTPSDLRRMAFGGELVDLRAVDPLAYEIIEKLHRLPFVHNQAERRGNRGLRVLVDRADTAIPELLAWANDQRIVIESIEEYLPPFEDVFIKLVNGKETDA